MDLDKSFNKNPSKRHHTSVNGVSRIVRIQTYPLELIFDFIREYPFRANAKNGEKYPGSHYIDSEGNSCKLRRARIYFEIGVDCINCSVKAKFFALEKWPDETMHFELYGINDVGEEVLITIDHIVAKYNGGKNELSNYQPMCKCCNELKGWS